MDEVNVDVDLSLTYAVPNSGSGLQRLQNEQLTLYHSYSSLLSSGSHAQLCAKASEVIKSRETINEKVDAMNCEVVCLAVCFGFPLLCLPAILQQSPFQANTIARGLHAEHVPVQYQRRGAIAAPPIRKSSTAEVTSSSSSSVFVSQRPSMTHTESSHEKTLTTASPFAVLDLTLERAFSGLPKASTSGAPVAKVLQVDNMSDEHVMEEIEHGLLSGFVVIVLSRAVVDRRLPEGLLAETGNLVCWDIFRAKARRVPAVATDARIALRVIGNGSVSIFRTDTMTVLGGFLDGGIFVLATFHMAKSGAPDRDLILNCFRDGHLCRVYYAKAPSGPVKVLAFFREVLCVEIKPLAPGAFYDLRGGGIAGTNARAEEESTITI
jgi:hypothetical protein